MTDATATSPGVNGERFRLDDMAETCARLASIIECNQEVLVMAGLRRETHAPSMRDAAVLKAAARTLDMAKAVEPGFRRLLKSIGQRGGS